MSERKSPHLVFGPIPSHILSLELLDLFLQMRPQHLCEGIHDFPHFFPSQLSVSASAFHQVRTQSLQALVHFLVLFLGEPSGFEPGHFLAQHGEPVSLFDVVVTFEVLTKPQAQIDQLARFETRPRCRPGVQLIPRRPEHAVIKLHFFCQAVEESKVGRGQWWQDRVFVGGGGSRGLGHGGGYMLLSILRMTLSCDGVMVTIPKS